MITEKIRNLFYTSTDFKKKIHDTITDADSLIENGVIDSFGLITLVSLLEETFCISLDTNDMERDNFESIENISAFLRAKGVQE